MACVADGERLVIIASKGGAPDQPGLVLTTCSPSRWLMVEVGTEKFQARAAVAPEPERTRLFNKMVETAPGFADYQHKTTRVIPVVTLTRVK